MMVRTVWKIIKREGIRQPGQATAKEFMGAIDMSETLDIVYTRHAREKFALLARYNFPVTEQQVADTIHDPALLTEQSGGRLIAQRAISEQHLLRVVYRTDGKVATVITFYPAHRRRYET